MKNTKVDSELRPRLGMILFQSVDNDVYIQCHKVSMDGHRFVFGPGYPAKESTLLEFYQAINPKVMRTYKTKELLDENILYVSNDFGTETIIWYNKPQIRNLTFDKHTKIKSGDVLLPGVIFKYVSGKLFIYCFAGKSRPTLNTRIYHSPFFNVYEGGDVCLGSAKIKADSSDVAEVIKDSERAFFDSVFTHASGGTKLAEKVTWQKIMKQKVLNRTMLVRSPKTLKGILE